MLEETDMESIKYKHLFYVLFFLLAALLLNGCSTGSSSGAKEKAGSNVTNSKKPLVVFISAENQYNAAKTLPEFAKELQDKYGLSCEILQSSTDASSPERHEISGMEALTEADLVILFARRRAFPAEQMKYLHDYLDNGKPLIGLRTACHAFDAQGRVPEGHVDWPKFDPEVLGGNYHGHYSVGPVNTVNIIKGAEGHPILMGVETPFTSIGVLYRTSPLAESTKCLLTCSIPGNDPEPVAWTNSYKNARIFFTSLGCEEDFENPQFRRLLINAVFWAMDKPVESSKIKIQK